MKKNHLKIWFRYILWDVFQVHKISIKQFKLQMSFESILIDYGQEFQFNFKPATINIYFR